jgi:xanthine/CO dehydrogenase XdhC/CoxF family maturation factor
VAFLLEELLTGGGQIELGEAMDMLRVGAVHDGLTPPPRPAVGRTCAGDGS